MKKTDKSKIKQLTKKSQENPKKIEGSNNRVNSQASLVMVFSVFAAIGAFFTIYVTVFILPTSAPILFKWYTVVCVYLVIASAIYYFRKIRKVVVSLLIFSVMFSGACYIWNQDYKHGKVNREQADQRKTPQFSITDTRYKILILPFPPDPNLKNGAGWSIYDGLLALNKKEKLNLNIKYADQLTGLNTEDSAAYVKKFNHADLIIYGRYYPAEGIVPSQIRINYIATDNFLLGQMNKRTTAEPIITSIAGLSRGELQSDIQFIIRFIVGYKEFTQGHFYEAINRLSKIRNNFNPDKVDFLLGTAYFRVENYETSILFLQKALSKNPNLIAAHVNLCYDYIYVGNLERAFMEAELSIRNNTRIPLGYLARGNVKLSRTDYQDAIADYSKAIAIDSNCYFAYNNRGYAKNALQKYQEAIIDYSKAIAINSKFAIVYNNRGIAKTNIKDYKGAITDFSKAIEIDPKYAKAYNNRGNANLYNKNNLKAISDYTKAIENDSTNPEIYINRGIVKGWQQDDQEAITDFSKAIQIDSNCYKAYKLRGNAKATQHDDQGAIDDFSKAIKINPKDTEAYFNREELIIKRGDIHGALNDYSKIIEIDHKNVVAYFKRGYIKYRIKDYQGAISDFFKAHEIDPTNVSYVYSMGMVYSEIGDYPNAIAWTENGLLLNPNDPSALDNLGYCYLQIKCYAATLVNLNKCISLKPDQIDAILGIALVYYYNNDLKDAKKYLDQAKNLKPILKQGLVGFEAFKKEGWYYSDLNDKTLKKMFEELK